MKNRNITNPFNSDARAHLKMIDPTDISKKDRELLKAFMKNEWHLKVRKPVVVIPSDYGDLEPVPHTLWNVGHFKKYRPLLDQAEYGDEIYLGIYKAGRDSVYQLRTDDDVTILDICAALDFALTIKEQKARMKNSSKGILF